MKIYQKSDLKLSKESERELDKIRKEVDIMLKPLFEELGVDIDAEELHWTDGEVFVINKKTRKRRELQSFSQEQLNNKLFQHGIKTFKSRGGGR